MNPFSYRDGILHAEEVPLPQVAAAHGTPCYVYSRAALQSRFDEFRRVLAGRDALVCYAVKANSNLAILSLFARAGAGFDIVSGGELARVLAAGGDPAKVVFSGVGKTADEMREALAAGILCFNVESAAELERLNQIAGSLNRRAPVSLRVNPDVDPKTHPYIATGLKSAKFGIPFEEALPLYRRARALPHIDVHGIDCHIGSQLIDPAPAAEAAAKLLGLVDALGAEGIVLSHVDLGGGMGIRYRDEAAPTAAEYLAPLLAVLAGRRERLLFEPGRSLVGNAGVLLTRIEYLKHGGAKSFAVVDAAMNDLMRPALYDAWHDILPVTQTAGAGVEYEIVGPVCESGDFLGHARRLAVAQGDLLAVMSAGAYGMAMSSNYNTRPRAAEVIVDGSQIHLVRERERAGQLFAGERVLP
ncbi:MAG: Diaminopimelate decarboxylase [Rhodocyclaceae bacterium]|nr:MAG: diaminopimelate decarboxylase [Rhodocyclaceae bacterium]MBE7424155.1 diaminopimelate decarboxylase [Zoogloeaceae bacterium]MBV6407195.1 Diaminopimelate decarboxylase [Rhodocyclaceae bacterium]MCK6383638.1 diaminopimelate decarboxylase [Rhodocyclaceae bacterium]